MTEAEFDRIIYEHQGIIWKVCKIYFRNAEDQKDLFQDVLLKLWKGRLSFQGASKISTWIYRVSLNQAIDKSRRSRLKTLELTPALSQKRMEPDSAQGSIYDLEALYLAIDRLNPVEKALTLLYLEQKPYREISEIIGISEKNVSVKLVRIKERLKDLYVQMTKVN